MNFTLKGRIEEIEFYNGKYINFIATPAPDPYSQPSSYKVHTDTQVGNAGMEVTLDITVSGYVRKKPYKDKVTGQPKVYWEDNVILKGRPAIQAVQAPPSEMPAAVAAKR